MIDNSSIKKATSVADRVALVLERLEYSQNALAKALGIRQSNVHFWLNGGNMPKTTALAFEAVLGVRHQWLLDNSGDMFLGDRTRISDQEKELLDAFQKLPEKRREFIVGFTQAAALEEAKSRDS